MIVETALRHLEPVDASSNIKAVVFSSEERVLKRMVFWKKKISYRAVDLVLSSLSNEHLKSIILQRDMNDLRWMYVCRLHWKELRVCAFLIYQEVVVFWWQLSKQNRMPSAHIMPVGAGVIGKLQIWRALTILQQDADYFVMCCHQFLLLNLAVNNACKDCGDKVRSFSRVMETSVAPAGTGRDWVALPPTTPVLPRASRSRQPGLVLTAEFLKIQACRADSSSMKWSCLYGWRNKTGVGRKSLWNHGRVRRQNGGRTSNGLMWGRKI